MKRKVSGQNTASEKLVKDIRQKIRKIYSAKEKISIVLDCLRGEISIAELDRREGFFRERLL
jgi:transposase-like protein